MTRERLDWDTLRGRFPPRLVEALREPIEEEGPLRLTTAILAAQANASLAEAAELLHAVADTGTLTRRDGFVCPCHERLELDAEEAARSECPRPHCGRSFEEDGEKPLGETFFEREAPPSRDVPWVLTLHGMNSVGHWQEAIAWYLAMTYRHSVPVFVYKYGLVRPGALLEFRQQQLRDQLIAKIHAVCTRAHEAGYGGRPDVIAHSFGTWLLGHALEADSKLQLGRVILTGCILRPDFDWKGLLDAGRVEAVLCHTAGRDLWAAVAHYGIPDSGPSGRRGFDDRQNVLHNAEPSFRHSDFFEERFMPGVFQRVWKPFLTASSERLTLRWAQAPPAVPWAPAPWVLRAGIVRFALLAVATALVTFLGASLVVGVAVLGRWLFPA